ncbi:MAG: hypothetical protein H5T59_10625 [Anaerolineae bacterium]|nr:hypothetical protein [Anaerolineae bacterium]
MTTETSIPCQIAQQRYRNAALWKNLWTILLFAFGAAVVVFLVLAIVFFIREDWIPGAVSTVSTIAQGAAIKWVLDRRNEAAKEEEEAYKEVQAQCGDTRHADEFRAGLRLL